MTDTTSWRDDYGQIITKLIAEGATIDGVADQLDMPLDLVADILARTHPLGPVLHRWAQRAAAKTTTCPSTTASSGWPTAQTDSSGRSSS